LATHDGNTVTIDAAGNTTADPAENLSFTYDDHNRMVEAYVGAVLQSSYVYNGQGQRVKKVEATGDERTFIFHYGLGGELIGETIYSDTGAKIGERDYLWLDTLPLAQSEREFSGSTITSDQFVYLHADQLNTPRLATNGSGTVVWRWDSDAFGVGDADLDPDSDTNEVSVRLRFPGQYLDEETGLHYNYFRDYDPATGRYLESDPIGLGGGLNTYGYAGANPLLYSDPTGLFFDEAGQFLKVCAQKAPVMATSAVAAAASGLVLFLTPNSTAQCDVVVPEPDSTCEVDDECARLLAQIKAHIGVMRVANTEMLADQHGLFRNAFNVNPGGPLAGFGTWTGHVDRYNGLVTGLARMIQEAMAKGCAVPAEAYEWLNRPPPNAPARYLSSPRG
jgi:RHS repeat-associated protein